MVLFSHFASPGSHQGEADRNLGQAVCLLGGRRSGKTSLLFNLASYFAASGAHVLFIASRLKLNERPPLLWAGQSTSAPALQRVHLKYVEDHESLCAFLANIHQTQFVFELIVIDDLTTYFTKTHVLDRNLENLAFALAMLKDAADFFTSQLTGGVPPGADASSAHCCLAVSDSAAEENPALRSLLARWCPSILQIHPLSDTRLSFCLMPVLDASEADTSPPQKILFKIAPTNLVALAPKE
jgi:hypothetical protein